MGLAAWHLGRARRFTPPARWGIGLALFAWTIGLLSLLPVGPGLRTALQGGVGTAVEGALAQVLGEGRGTDPARG